MESQSYRERFLEDMAAWLRQEERAEVTRTIDTTKLFSSADVLWLDRMGISLSPDRR
jgi:hypothetical protein